MTIHPSIINFGAEKSGADTQESTEQPARPLTLEEQIEADLRAYEIKPLITPNYNKDAPQ